MQTGAAMPKTAPNVPVLLMFPLTLPFEWILKVIIVIVIPSRMLIVIRIILECKKFPVMPSLYNPNIKVVYSEGLVFVSNININLKFFDKMLIEKNMNADIIAIKKYFFIEITLFTDIQA